MRYPPPIKHKAGFVLRDLLAVVLVLAALGVVGGGCLARSKKIAGLAQCAANLKELGLATALYAKDNDNRLPFAFVKYSDGRTDSVTWDALIFPYIDREGSKAISSSAFDRKHAFLQCPDDKVEGKDTEGLGRLRRTYSMSGHDMAPANWPPGPANRTGPGLWWSDSIADGPASLVSREAKIPAVRLAEIPTPAGTLLLTEQVCSNNFMFNYLGATIKPGDPQIDPAAATNQLHQGMFNYLMVDGHVETMSPKDKPSMWAINQKQ